MISVLIIGKGAREHAICWKLLKSSKLKKLFVLPGNLGMQSMGAEVLEVDISDHEGILKFIKMNQIDYVIVGSEGPLATGLIDDISRGEHVRCIGPERASARFESSKQFTKSFLKKYHIPTAQSCYFNSLETAEKALGEMELPLVIKADGLAEGKGVFIVHDQAQAKEALNKLMLERVFGTSGDQIVIENFLEGKEISFTLALDGEHGLPLMACRDHKRLLDHDEGNNTGGMGVIAPVLAFDDPLYHTIMEEIVAPTLAGMKEEDLLYKGFLFIGLMIQADKPYVLEFNCRLGDPEAQAIMIQMESDLFDLFEAISEGTLDQLDLKYRPGSSLVVIMASEGYPDSPPISARIEGLSHHTASMDQEENGILTHVFQAATCQKEDGVYSNGGRVLSVGGCSTSKEALKQAVYERIKQLSWKGVQFRQDIGNDL